MPLLRAHAAAPLFGVVLLLTAGCGSLDEPPRPTAGAARTLGTAIPLPTASTPSPARAPTRPPPARTPTPPTVDESDVEQSVAEARARPGASWAARRSRASTTCSSRPSRWLPPTGGEQLPRVAAARWLRQRATGRVCVIAFQRHERQALIIASTQRWAPLAPLSTSQLGLTLRRDAASGAQDPEHGEWRIDVLEAE